LLRFHITGTSVLAEPTTRIAAANAFFVGTGLQWLSRCCRAATGRHSAGSSFHLKHTLRTGNAPFLQTSYESYGMNSGSCLSTSFHQACLDEM
jgi:hypothetical protein